MCKWKLSTHLILEYFLCCCSVTAPEGKGRVVEKVWTRKEEVGVVVEEKAEAVVIWHRAGCSFHMFDMRSCLYNSQKYCKSRVTLTTSTLFCSLLGGEVVVGRRREMILSPCIFYVFYATILAERACHTMQWVVTSHTDKKMMRWHHFTVGFRSLWESQR